MTEWISVEEQVPETKKDVLVAGDTGQIFIAYWFETKWGNKFVSTDYGHCEYGGKPLVTHWMPLPEAPHE